MKKDPLDVSSSSERLSFASDFAWNVVSSGIAAVGAFAANVVVGRFLAVEDFGAYSLILTLYILFATLGTLGTHNAIIKYVAEYREQPKIQGQYLTGALLISALVGVAITIVIVAGGGKWIGSYFFHSTAVGRGLRVISWGLPVFLCNRVLLGLLTGTRAMKAYALAEILRFVLWLTFSYFFLALGHGLDGAARAIVVSEIPVLFYAGLHAIQKVTLQFQEVVPKLGSLVLFGFQVFLSAVVGIIYSRLGLLFLGHFGTKTGVAVMNVASLFFSGLLVAPSVLGRITYPVFTEYWTHGDEVKASILVKETARLAAVICLLLGGILSVLLPFLIPLIYPDKPELVNGATVFAILMLGTVPYSISSAISGVLLGVGRPDYSLRITFVVLLVSIFLGVVLIPQYGVAGAAISLAATSLVSGLQVIWVISSRIGLRLDLKPLGSVLLLSVVISSSQLLLPFGWLRLAVGTATLVFSGWVLWSAKIIHERDMELVANLVQIRFARSLEGIKTQFERKRS
jgi:stage V sporulation protein B